MDLSFRQHGRYTVQFFAGPPREGLRSFTSRRGSSPVGLRDWTFQPTLRQHQKSWPGNTVQRRQSADRVQPVAGDLFLTKVQAYWVIKHGKKITCVFGVPAPLFSGPGRGAQIHPRQMEHPQRHCCMPWGDVVATEDVSLCVSAHQGDGAPDAG